MKGNIHRNVKLQVFGVIKMNIKLKATQEVAFLNKYIISKNLTSIYYLNSPMRKLPGGLHKQ